MASQGPNGAGTGANVAGAYGSFVAWSNPGNVTASDDSRATAALNRVSGLTRSTQYLIASNFGFSIPTGATINGIVVEVERSSTTTAGSPRDGLVQLTSDAAETGLAGDDKSSATTWPTTDAYATYGSSSDTWAFSPTVAAVNATGFGVAIRATVNIGKGALTVRVDHVRVTVYYTEAAAGNRRRRVIICRGGS